MYMHTRRRTGAHAYRHAHGHASTRPQGDARTWALGRVHARTHALHSNPGKSQCAGAVAVERTLVLQLTDGKDQRGGVVQAAQEVQHQPGSLLAPAAATVMGCAVCAKQSSESLEALKGVCTAAAGWPGPGLMQDSSTAGMPPPVSQLCCICSGPGPWVSGDGIAPKQSCTCNQIATPGSLTAAMCLQRANRQGGTTPGEPEAAGWLHLLAQALGQGSQLAGFTSAGRRA